MTFKARLAACLVAASLSLPQAVSAEMGASVNLIGNTGLIDMPSGEMQPDGFLTMQGGRMGPISRYTLSFQFTPRLSGSFRYIGIKDWNDVFCPPDCTGVNKFETYFDRNFDISYQILTEGRLRPALSIGLIDFAGTGINSAEYIAATKTFAGRLKLTGGLGFGRLASGNAFMTIGNRPAVVVGKGGKPNYDLWFRGDVAAFGGLEYKISDKWTAKVEYSSDTYAEEAGARDTFTRRSPVNFGVEYQAGEHVRLGAYSMYGDTFAFNFVYQIDPSRRPKGNLTGPGPYPVLHRPSPAANPSAWVTGWTEQPTINAQFITAVNAYLERDPGLEVEGMEITGDRVQVRFRNAIYDAPSQAIGRVARALTHVMPASIETFELVPVENGMAATKVTIYRANLEKFDGSLGAAEALWVRSRLAEAGPVPVGYTVADTAYPRLNWGILPATDTRTFDPGDPLQINLGVKATFRYEPSPGFVLSGTAIQMALRGITNPPNPEPSVLPHVRSEAAAYQTAEGAVVDNLTAAYYTRLAPSVYGRITAGYLERMFGGISGEVLWRPQGEAFALGIEANYAQQRNTDGGFGFDQFDYGIATGHVSAYLDLGKGYTGQIDVGRYLAGDSGATVTLARDFSNGWRVGGFATLTTASAEEFGEGSFDKGVFLDVPFNWFLGRPTRAQKVQTIRPIQRDGGARLEVDGRLYEVLKDYDAARISADWGRLWN